MIYFIPYTTDGCCVTIVNDEGVDLDLAFTQVGEDRRDHGKHVLLPGQSRDWAFTGTELHSFIEIVASHAAPISAYWHEALPVYVAKGVEGDLTLEDLLINPFNQRWLRRKSSFVLPNIVEISTDLVLTNFETFTVYAHIVEKTNDGEEVDTPVFNLKPQSVTLHECSTNGYARVVIKNSPAAFKSEPILALVTVLAKTGQRIMDSN